MTEILNAETARTITNEKVSKFKDEIFKRISLEAECGYSSCKFNTIGRWAQPSEVADLTAFLASGKASYN